MPRGGARRGAGRPKGAATKKSREVADRLTINGETPLEFLLDVMRNPGVHPHARLDAAKAAAPYMHPKLASVTHSGKIGVTVNITGDDASLL